MHLRSAVLSMGPSFVYAICWVHRNSGLQAGHTKAHGLDYRLRFLTTRLALAVHVAFRFQRIHCWVSDDEGSIAQLCSRQSTAVQ